MSTGGARRSTLNHPAIYAIVHLGSGQAYVGQAYKWWQRWLEHRSRLANNRHNNPHLQAAFKKYGHPAFRYILIEWCARARLTEREAYWMAQFKQRAGIYNAYPAGGSPIGVKRSAETRAKIGASSRGRNSGRKHTAEELAKMSEWQRGRKRPPFSAQWRAKMEAAIWSRTRGKPRPILEATKQKIRATLTGSKWSVRRRATEYRRKIIPGQLCLPI